jgi:Secretion system C-terminal sorting domain
MLKKVLFGLMASLTMSWAQAQVIQVTGGNKHTYFLDAANSIDCHMPFKNVTGKATVFAYKMVSSDFPSDWVVSFCDNRNCFATLVDEDSFAVVSKDAETEFKITVDPQGNADTSKVVYAVYDRNNPSVRDTVEFNFILQWGAGLMESGKVSQSLYPNPATNVLHFANIENLTSVRIYGADSKLVCTEMVSENQNTLNIETLPKGFYFVSYLSGTELIRSNFVKQ